MTAIAADDLDVPIAELPLGDLYDDVAAMYRSIFHRHPVVNGYSGFLRRTYLMLKAAIEREGDAALRRLALDSPMIVVVHPGLMLTAALLAGSFYVTYRPSGDACAADGTCGPALKRTAKIVLWLATVLVILVITFPYYVNWLI